MFAAKSRPRYVCSNIAMPVSVLSDGRDSPAAGRGSGRDSETACMGPSQAKRVAAHSSSHAELLLRLRFSAREPPQKLGPGKVALMEHIDREASISGAARAMHMSYHRAWTIVNEINAMFREPLVRTQLGGVNGGGASITPLGREVVRRYRSIESSVWKHAAKHIAALEAAVVRR